MEITKNNFDSMCGEVMKEIEGCDFVSIDLELSGLWRNGEPGYLDSLSDVYQMVLNSAIDFIPLQVGISVWTIQPNKRYRSKTYVFYVMPRRKNSNQLSFSIQASAVDFLITNGFNFNKTIYEGISYLNLDGEAELSEQLEERRFYREKSRTKIASDNTILDIPEEHQQTVTEACDRLCSVLEEECTEKEVRVPGLNGFVRRLVYQTIKQRYPDGELQVDTREGCMVSRKGGLAAKTMEELDQEQIEKAIGFSKIIRTLSKSMKPVVGHNMFLDLCHIVNQYLCKLPDTYQEFKGLMRGVMPTVLDTKLLATSAGLKDLISSSTLERIHFRIKDSPFYMPPVDCQEGYGYSEGDPKKYHDAGFDSYVTGLCFISMYNYITKNKGCQTNSKLDLTSGLITKFVNRIYVNNCPDSPMHLAGVDDEPDRSNYFHVQFPKEWTAKDIIHLFSAFSQVNIFWINLESCWVSLLDRSQVEAAQMSLCNGGTNPLVKVSTYSSSQHLHQPGRRRSHRRSTPGQDDKSKVKESSGLADCSRGVSQLMNAKRRRSLDGSGNNSTHKKVKSSQIDKQLDNSERAISELEKAAEGTGGAMFTGSSSWQIS